MTKKQRQKLADELAKFSSDHYSYNMPQEISEVIDMLNEAED